MEKLADFDKEYGIKDATFEASSLTERDVSTIDFKGNLCIYDIEKGMPKFEVKAHEGMGNTIHGTGAKGADYGAPELVTGGSDGGVRVWDPRQESPVVSLEPSDSEDIKPDGWAVKFGNAFNSEERCIVAGYDNGDVKLFDLRMNLLKWDTNLSNGIGGLEFDRSDIPMNKLVVTTLESKFHVFDMRTYHPEMGYCGLEEMAHKSTIWGVSHYPQNRDLFTTLGGNGSINLYRYKYPTQRAIKDMDDIEYGVPGTVELLNEKTVAQQPIVSLDWNEEKFGLGVMGALDQQCKVIICTKLNLY